MADLFRATVHGFADLRRLRAELTRWLARTGCGREAASELVLAVNEVVTNAVEASPEHEARLEAAADPPAVQVVVTNEGPEFDDEVARRPNPVMAERGRGLDLAGALTDSLAFDHAGGCTTATLVKHC